MRRATKADIARMWELHQKGWSRSHIAYATGFTCPAISYHLIKLGALRLGKPKIFRKQPWHVYGTEIDDEL